jgi:glutamate synthase (NADPH/NADH) large chain
MSLATFIGNNGNILDEDKMHCHCVALRQPILANHELEKLRSIDTGMFNAKTLQTYFRADGRPGSLENGLARLCRYAEDAVQDGFEVLILSDRAVDSEHAPIPSLLAVSAVHHHLIKLGYRGSVGLVVEAGDVWEVHHFACLLAFGGTAINPYLALSTIRTMHEARQLGPGHDPAQLTNNYIKAVCDGLLKIFSKMGISTLQSYHGAQVFEILGLNQAVVDQYFCGAVTRIGGLGLDEIARETLYKHFQGFRSTTPEEQTLLPDGGVYHWRRRGEAHVFNPETVHLLQLATRTNNYATYQRYARLVNEPPERLFSLRGLLDFARHRAAIALEEVEPAAAIMRRFATGAMSFGSISHEAHSTLAIAMNRIGGKSNTGEGGEDPLRYEKLANGDSMRSAIKQVASARFGVTAHYLTNADELQIKMAQGAKPGEGGQLPGHKVDAWIAKVRHATPGVGLISPPPHHDIYSIEDLAQLIFDLKNANRAARINVKLVSKAGRGHHRGGRGQSPRRRHPHCRLRRRHRRLAPQLHQARRPALGAGPGRGPPNPGAQPAPQPGGAASRRPAQNRPRPGRGGPAGGRRMGRGHGGAGGRRLRADAQMPPQHLPRGRGHPRPRAAQALQRPARAHRQPVPLPGRGAARNHGRTGFPDGKRDGRAAPSS